MKQAATILIVEDEPDILNINARMMRRRGYQILTAETVGESLKTLSEVLPDLLILDIMLPDGSGYEICKSFRQYSDNPVIFLTGKSQIADKIEGLENGGDYYLTKPYSFEELLAVTERLLERHFKVKEKQDQLSYLQKGTLLLDLSKNKAFVNGKDTELTAKEFSLLLLLMKNEDVIFSPDELYEAVWGVKSASDTRTVRFHIGNLKKKIDTENADDYDIVSIYGKGYSFTTR